MRSTVILLLLLWRGTAQGQFPFPQENARWTQSTTFYSTGQWPPETYGTIYESYYVNGSDTMINGRSYTMVHDPNGSYYAGVRDSAGKVMVMPFGGTMEELLYDLTLPIGVDTLIEFWAGGTTMAWMRSEGPIGPDGRLVVVCVEGGFPWIEGIGCTAGLFLPPYVNISGSSSMLLCMSHNDSIRYPETSPGICDLATSVAMNEAVMIEVYPNPVVDMMYLRSPEIEAVERYWIYSTDGRSVLSGILNGTERNRISLEGLAPGPYVLVVPGAYPRMIVKSGIL